jgi:hypothetical protein
MTPKEWNFVMHLVQQSVVRAYDHGHREGKAGKPPNPSQFQLNKGHEMILKKELNVFLQSR